MKRRQLIEKYIEFFGSKDHKEIANSSLIPENDPTTLFISAGMQPLVPFLLGQKHPQGKRLCNFQRCIRTGDIEEVGDAFHHTFFEMLGNWSLGDYWKKESIEMSFEFLTKVLKIPKEKLAVTCFAGDKEKGIVRDEESAKIWKSLGIPEKRIAFTKKDNWWGPAGETGPCGPDTEIFYWKRKDSPPKEFDSNDEENWVEIWNNVLMQYNKVVGIRKDKKGNFKEAKQKNIDTGMGVERTIAMLNGFEDNYLTEVWKPIIQKIEEISGKKYGEYKDLTVYMRVIADHLKSSVFIIADGICPGNKEQGYVLKRLIRRAVRYGRELGLRNFSKKVVEPVFDIYEDYGYLQKNKDKILDEVEKEEKKFNKTLEKGINIFNKLVQGKKDLDCKESFLLYQSYGFPIEMIEEECKKRGIKFSRKDFENECKRHKELSRTAAKGRFKSGLADDSEATKKLHTAAHLLLEALKEVLNDNNIEQKGSNINPERLRLDFNFPRKLTKEELQKIEDLVNKKIEESCKVIREEMSLEEAKNSGACGIFENKYGDKVSVYTIGKSPEDYFSKEICTGPHVSDTSELGRFKIKKEQSSGAGVRRIKATLGSCYSK